MARAYDYTKYNPRLNKEDRGGDFRIGQKIRNALK